MRQTFEFKKIERNLDYVLDRGFSYLNVFQRLYLRVVKKPYGKLSAFVRNTGETLRLRIPFLAFGAWDLGIVAHVNHDYESLD